MSLTLAQAARRVGPAIAPREAIEAGIARIGPEADESLDGRDRSDRAQRVRGFVHGLRGVGVQASHDLERMLLTALEAAPVGEHAVPLSDSISVIRARNHLGQLCQAAGMDWAEAMKVQSAVSEAMRYVCAHGGGLLETHSMHGQASVLLRVNAAEELPDRRAYWLHGVSGICHDLSITAQGAGVAIRFWLGGAIAAASE